MEDLITLLMADIDNRAEAYSKKMDEAYQELAWEDHRNGQKAIIEELKRYAVSFSLKTK